MQCWSRAVKLYTTSVRKTGVCSPFIFAAIVLFACQSWANPVTVHVVDADGKPVAGATVSKLVAVAFVKSRLLLETKQVTLGVTDTAGTIQLDCDPSERSAFLVAAGKSLRTFGFWGCVPPTYLLTLQGPNPTYSGRIIDATGNAAATATLRIRLINYQLLESVRIFTPDYPRISYDLTGRTDADGRFNLPAPQDGSLESVAILRDGAWHSAMPFDGDADTALSALKDGSYVGHTDPIAIPNLAEPTTRPAPTLTLAIHLRVFDASTNQPIENIRVIPGGCRSPDQSFRTLDSYAIDLLGNEATWTFYDNSWAYFLRVESNGYAATPTRIVKASEKNADVEVRLIKAKPLSITVRTPSGHPASGATAYLSTPTIDLNVPALESQRDDALPIAVAGDDGVIHFVPPNEPYRLAIVQVEGSAEVSCTDLSDKPLVLDAWASADIQLGSPNHPLVRAFVEPQSGISETLHCPIDWMGFYHSDANGHATIPAWRPGDFRTTVMLSRHHGGYDRLELSERVAPAQARRACEFAGDDRRYNRAGVPCRFSGMQMVHVMDQPGRACSSVAARGEPPHRRRPERRGRKSRAHRAESAC